MYNEDLCKQGDQGLEQAIVAGDSDMEKYPGYLSCESAYLAYRSKPLELAPSQGE